MDISSSVIRCFQHDVLSELGLATQDFVSFLFFCASRLRLESETELIPSRKFGISLAPEAVPKFMRRHATQVILPGRNRIHPMPFPSTSQPRNSGGLDSPLL